MKLEKEIEEEFEVYENQIGNMGDGVIEYLRSFMQPDELREYLKSSPTYKYHGR